MIYQFRFCMKGKICYQSYLSLSVTLPVIILSCYFTGHYSVILLFNELSCEYSRSSYRACEASVVGREAISIDSIAAARLP